MRTHEPLPVAANSARMARFLGFVGLALGVLLLGRTAVLAADRAMPYVVDGAASPCSGPAYRQPAPWHQRGGLPLVNGATVRTVSTDYGVVPGRYATPGSGAGVPVIAGGSPDCGYGRPLGTGRFVLLERAPLRIDVEFTINDDDWAHDTAPVSEDPSAQ